MKPKSVDEYIKGAAPEARVMLKKMRKIIRAAAPKATEKISYGMPMYFHHGMMVSFGAFKKHVGFYSLTSGFLPRFKKELSKYKIATGTIQFPIGEPLPEKLIKKLVKERVKMKETGAKEKASAKQRPKKN